MKRNRDWIDVMRSELREAEPTPPSAGCVSSPLPLPYWFVWSQERFCGAQTGRWEMMGLF